MYFPQWLFMSRRATGLVNGIDCHHSVKGWNLLPKNRLAYDGISKIHLCGSSSLPMVTGQVQETHVLKRV